MADASLLRGTAPNLPLQALCEYLELFPSQEWVLWPNLANFPGGLNPFRTAQATLASPTWESYVFIIGSV